MPRSFLGTISHPLLLLVLATGVHGRAWGEVITYGFTGTVDVVADAEEYLSFPEWLQPSATFTGFVRWETELIDTNPGPQVGNYNSLVGGIYLEFPEGDGYLTTTGGPRLGVNRDLGPELPFDGFSLETNFSARLNFSFPIRRFLVLLESGGEGDALPTTLLDDGTGMFYLDGNYTRPGGEHFLQVKGGFDSLTRLDRPFHWSPTIGSNWNDSSNWSGGEVPNSAGLKVHLGPLPHGPGVVTVDVPVALTDLVIDSPLHSYRLSGAEANTMSFLGPAQLDVQNGAHEFEVALIGRGSLTKTGAGNVSFYSPVTVAGDLHLKQGNVRFAAESNSTTRLNVDTDVEIDAGASVATTQQARLAVEEGSQAMVLLSGGSWTGGYAGHRYIGDRGDATLRIENGGTMSSNDSYLGYEATGSGEVVVSGAGSS